jgi:Predicted O-methyltransferase
MVDHERLKAVYPQYDEMKAHEEYVQYAQDLLDCFGALKYSSALEIGFENGVSATAILHCQPTALLVSVDVRPTTAGHRYLEQRLDLMERLTFACMPSDRLWSRVGVKDLIYVDGDHGYEGCLRDVWNGWAKLAPGGTLVMDDTTHHLNEREGGYGCKKVAEQMQIHFKDQIKEAKMVGRLFQVVKNG